MKIGSIFRKPCLVPYALICGYGLFALTAPPQPMGPQAGEASVNVMDSPTPSPDVLPSSNRFAKFDANDNPTQRVAR